MIRVTRLVVSKPMYALKPDTWRPSGIPGIYQVDAVWFKRKRGKLVATMGTYQPMVLRRDQQPAGDTYEEWIAAADDNRYGGDWTAVWDGEGLMCARQPVSAAMTHERSSFLDAVLKGFPNVPDGYDGWWTFDRRLR